MAKCIGPAHSTEARGAVGALVYNTWRGVRVIKQHTSPAQPMTQRQLIVRALLIRFTRAWAGLTAQQRADWTTWANDHPSVDWTNRPTRMTGANAYCACNTLLVDAGQTPITSPPTVNAPAPVAGLTLTPSAGSISIAFTPAGGTSTQLDIWLYGPHSAGRQPTLTRAKHSGYSAAETSPVVKSGLSPGTWTVFARMLSETDGQTSTWVWANAIVT